jgi:hypothetical protein
MVSLANHFRELIKKDDRFELLGGAITLVCFRLKVSFNKHSSINNRLGSKRGRCKCYDSVLMRFHQPFAQIVRDSCQAVGQRYNPREHVSLLVAGR